MFILGFIMFSSLTVFVYSVFVSVHLDFCVYGFVSVFECVDFNLTVLNFSEYVRNSV